MQCAALLVGVPLFESSINVIGKLKEDGSRRLFWSVRRQLDSADGGLNVMDLRTQIG